MRLSSGCFFSKFAMMRLKRPFFRLFLSCLKTFVAVQPPMRLFELKADNLSYLLAVVEALVFLLQMAVYCQ